MSRPSVSSRSRDRGAFSTVHAHRGLMGLSYRRLVIVGMLAMITGLGQAAILILLVRAATALTADTQVISGSIGPLSAGNLTVAQLIALGFVVLAILAVAEIASSWAQATLQTTSQRTAQTRMLARYSNASFEAQIHLPRGENQEVVFRHTAQTGAVANALGMGLTSAVNFITLVGSALVLSPAAGLVVMAGLCFMLLALRPLVMLSRRISRSRTKASRRLGAAATERLELSREVKAYGVENQVDEKVRDQIHAVERLTHRMRFLGRLTSAGYRVGTYAMTLGMLAVINAIDASNLAALTGSLLMLLRALSYGQAAQSTYQQVSELAPVLEQLAEEEARFVRSAEAGGGTRPPSGITDIVLRDVWFEYGADEPVLHGIDLDIGRGDFLALVGPSGAGKSTLMSILLRLRTPSSGTVTVDGLPLGDIDRGWWLQRVAYVAQDPKLESGTVADAIRFHRNEISDDDIRQAARRAHIADEIEAWPLGYDTPVGQLGEGVSGGQRQRLALARALAGRPDVLLLDEPTSAVDPTSEQLIGETLDELRGEVTVVAIAHRFHTVESANRVVLMRDGQIVPNVGDDLETLSEFMSGGLPQSST